MRKNTIEWWFYKYLPKDVRDKAIMNSMKQHGRDKLFQYEYEIWDALNSAFTWSSTPEGSEFWSKQSDILYDNRINPTIY